MDSGDDSRSVCSVFNANTASGSFPAFTNLSRLDISSFLDQFGMFSQLPKQDWSKARLIDMFSIAYWHMTDVLLALGLFTVKSKKSTLSVKPLKSGLDETWRFPIAAETEVSPIVYVPVSGSKCDGWTRYESFVIVFLYKHNRTAPWLSGLFRRAHQAK